MINPIEWGVACEGGTGYTYAHYIPTGNLSTAINEKACSQIEEGLPSGVFYIENKHRFIPYGYHRDRNVVTPPYLVVEKNRDLFIKGTIESNFETTITYTPIKKTVTDTFCGSDFALAVVFDMYTGDFDLSRTSQCEQPTGFQHSLVSLKELSLSGKKYVIGYSDAFGTLDLLEIK